MVSIQECLVRGIQVFVFGDRITRYIMWYDTWYDGIQIYYTIWYPGEPGEMLSRGTWWNGIQMYLVKWYPWSQEQDSMWPSHCTPRASDSLNISIIMLVWKIIALRLYKIIKTSSTYADESKSPEDVCWAECCYTKDALKTPVLKTQR